MASRLTLTLPPAFGSKKVEVNTKRFSIGRTPENDLPLDDSTLSRRHAVIEDYDGVFYLTDCGSSNGTLINDQAVTVASELHDWDVLTFGAVGDVVVRLVSEEHAVSSMAESISGNASSVNPYSVVSQSHPSTPSATGYPSWLSPPIIAASAAVLILLVAGVALLVAGVGSGSRQTSRITKKPTPVIEDTDNNQNLDSPSPDVTVSNVNAGDQPNSDDTAALQLAAIEAAAAKVLTGISKDNRSVLTEKPLKEIEGQIQRYRNSPAGLREGLRAMKGDMAAVVAIARNNHVRPPLLIYATLASMDSGGRGDPTQVASQICPELAKMSKIFGDELANDSLLALAALEEGAALQFRITKLAGRVNDSPTTIRSIWYLHEHQVIRDETYSFVLRFIAIGVISQDPQKFGIAAEPLTL